MDQIHNDILDSNLDSKEAIQRRKLLPWWIKVFCWIFMIFGILSPIVEVLGLIGFRFNQSIYGLETNDPISILGLSLSAIFILKAITAFGLWFEKDWAITLGQIDAITGIIICIYVMCIHPFIYERAGSSFNFRLELLLLIPYLIKLNKIKSSWNKV